MDKIYYLTDGGLKVLLEKLSTKLNNNTVPEILFLPALDENGQPIFDSNNEQIFEVKYPNKWPTVKAVTDYLKNRNPLIVKQYNMLGQVVTSYTYNGEENVLIDLLSATGEDIDALF